MIFKNDSRQKEISKSIAQMTESEGWKYFTAECEKVIRATTPEVTTFSSEEALQIAGKLAFISGIKRALALAEKHKKQQG